MPSDVMPSLATVPDFLAYFALAIVFTAVLVFVYLWITPHREIALIRDNKPAAAISFGGAFLGFVLPLSSAIAHSVSLPDCAIWGAIALVVQLLVFFATKLVLPDLPQRIARDE